MNPISLFLVITNNGTGDYVGETWRLPFTVAPGGQGKPSVNISPKGNGVLMISGKLESTDSDGNVQPGKLATWQVNYQFSGGDDDPELSPKITVVITSMK